MSVVVLGVFNADTTYRVDQIPRAGETMLGTGFALSAGGKGSNQAVASARSGVPTRFITRLGTDAFADMAWGIWQDAGIEPLVRQDAELPTGAACILVEEDTGQNRIIVAPGAASRMDSSDARANRSAISGASVFLAQLEQPLAAAVAGLHIAREAGVTTILNPAPAVPLDDATLALCDVITPNETEVEILTGIAVSSPSDADRAADALLARGVGAVLITLGHLGAYLADARTRQHIPPMPAGPVVDTTGAGDALNGAFAAALARGASMLDAALFGSAASGWAITRAGASDAMPRPYEIAQVLHAHHCRVPEWL